MKFIVKREKLLTALKKVCNIIPTRPSIPILSHILLKVHKNYLTCISTNLDIEIVTHIFLDAEHILGAVTVPGRKFFDIFRSLPCDTEVSIILKHNKIFLYSKNSNFSLSTLPIEDFPNLKIWEYEIEFVLQQKILKNLFENTYFSMAHQDVRYYLNGTLLEIKKKKICAVATDGHRLAICSTVTDHTIPNYSIILPRKSILELMRLLENDFLLLKIQINKNNIRIFMEDYIFTSKLIEGVFPDYKYVLQKKLGKRFTIPCDTLKKALVRTSILSNEKLKGIRLLLRKNQLKIIAHNSQQEEAEEILYIDYNDTTLEICFNVSYILDILHALKSEYAYCALENPLSAMQIEDKNKDYQSLYIVMPMRL